MAKINMFLEMEIGITGGEEDGVDNTGVKADGQDQHVFGDGDRHHRRRGGRRGQYRRQGGWPRSTCFWRWRSASPEARRTAWTIPASRRMAKINMFLEMEIGITGGEEDGVDNT